MTEISPIKNILFSLFFVSIGLLLDVSFLMEYWEKAAGFSFLALTGKAIVAAMVVYVLCRSTRIAVLCGLALGQVGEFSFVLAQLAQEYHVLSSLDYQGFLCMSILTMMFTPFVMALAPKVAFLTDQSQMPKFFEAREDQKERKQGHVVIVGFGLNGQNLARVLTQTHIPFVVVELNLDLYRKAKERNYAVVFGDATHRGVLEKANVEQAKMLVLGISDVSASRRALSLARKMNAQMTLLVRTRHVEEIDDLYQLGATQVIAEEFETSVEIFARVLEEFRVPRNILRTQVDLVRQDRYSMLRGLSLSTQAVQNLTSLLAETTVETVAITQESLAIGQTLAQLNLRKESGTLVIGLVREGKTQTNPDPQIQLQAGDLLILVGSHAQLDRALSLLFPQQSQP